MLLVEILVLLLHLIMEALVLALFGLVGDPFGRLIELLMKRIVPLLQPLVGSLMSLCPVGMFLHKALVGLRVILFKMLQLLLPPLTALFHQLLITLRILLAQVIQALLEVLTPLIHEALIGLGAIFLQPLCPILSALPDLGDCLLIGLGVGLLQIFEPLADVGLLFLHDPAKFLRILSFQFL